MKIYAFPKEIEALALELQQANADLAAVRDQVRDEEIETFAAILSARDAEGKALYGNDRARDIALHRALKESATYQQARAAAHNLEALKAATAARLERRRREFQIALLDYEAALLGRRRELTFSVA